MQRHIETSFSGSNHTRQRDSFLKGSPVFVLVEGAQARPPRGGRPGTMRLWHSAPRPSGRAGSLTRASTARVAKRHHAPCPLSPPWEGLWPWRKAPSEARGGRIGTLRLMHSASRPSAGKSLRHMPSNARNYEHWCPCGRAGSLARASTARVEGATRS